MLWKFWKLMVTWDSRLVCHKITELELYTKVPMMTCKQPKTHITSQRSPSHRRHSLQKTLNRKKDCGTFIYSKHFNILNQSYMKSSCGKISFKITCRILPVFETGIYDDKTRMHIHKKRDKWDCYHGTSCTWLEWTLYLAQQKDWSEIDIFHKIFCHSSNSFVSPELHLK